MEMSLLITPLSSYVTTGTRNRVQHRDLPTCITEAGNYAKFVFKDSFYSM